MDISKGTNKIEYDIWLDWYITDACQLSCDYCFNSPELLEHKKFLSLDYLKVLFEYIKGNVYDKRIGLAQSIDIERVICGLRKSKKTALLSFGGGEPFLVKNFVDFCLELTNEHYISFVSNFISGNVREFADKINPERTLPLVASCHVDELHKKKLLDVFAKNVLYLKAKNFNVAVRAVVYPPHKKQLLEIAQLLLNKYDILIEYQPFVGEYKGVQFPQGYSSKELDEYNLSFDPEVFLRKSKLCNAGYNVFAVDVNGNCRSCYQINQKNGNIYDAIVPLKELTMCSSDSCGCPYPVFNNDLFTKAKVENNIL